MSDELKPCGHCDPAEHNPNMTGNEPHLCDASGLMVVHCGWCGFKSGEYETEAEAIAAWNHRPGEDAARREGIKFIWDMYTALTLSNFSAWFRRDIESLIEGE